uniref:Sulfotransferase domain-containing protein n=1 Tax=Heterosigma akashiwo TaxID=2829 RepID=A0A6V2VC67_HETAK
MGGAAKVVAEDKLAIGVALVLVGCFLLQIVDGIALSSCNAYNDECCDFFDDSAHSCECFKPMNDRDPHSRLLCSNDGDSVTYVMKGIPKSGTTWLDVLTGNMIRAACPLQNGTETNTCTLTTSLCLNQVVPRDKFKLHWNGVTKVDYAVCDHNKHLGIKDGSFERTIWIIRDPRDQAISSHFWNGGKRPISVGVAKKELQRSIQSFKEWYGSVRKQKHRDILIFRYEELNQGNKHILQQIYDFFGISCTVPLTNELATHIFEISSFENMKAKEKNNTLLEPSRHKKHQGHPKVRSGKNYGYRHEHPPAFVAQADWLFQQDPLLNRIFESYRIRCHDDKE